LIQGADLSPDGTQAVYVQFVTDPEEEKDFTSLWLVDVDTKDARQLTAGTGRDSAPAFSPDGKKVAFVSDRSGTAQIHVISIDGGEARQVTRLDRGVAGGPAWSPDGESLAFAAGPQGEARDPSRAYRVTRTIYRFDAIGYIDDVKQDIYVVGAEGGEARRLTADVRMNNNPQWTPDGRGLVYVTALDPNSASPWPSLSHVDLDGKVTDIAQPEGLTLGVGGFAPDGRLVFPVYQIADRSGAKSELYAADLTTGTYERLTENLEGQVAGGLQGDSPASALSLRTLVTAGGDAVVQVQVGGRVPLYSIGLSGDGPFKLLTPGDRECVPLATAADKVLFVASDFNEPGDLYLLDGDREHRLTNLNEEVLGDVDLPEVEEVIASGADGVRVEGWFMKPAAGTAPFPTVLYIHGGPHGAFGHTFHADMQLLAGAGFGVVLANHRASTGYGDAFAAIAGDWGNNDYLDLMAAVDQAVEAGLADPDRLGVCGLSGGGNLTCWIVGQTDRFKAAVPENPVTNFVSMFGVQDLGIWFAQAETGGAPHEIPETYARMSPITHAHRCTTPTLLVQGELDMRCPPEQAEQFYATLKLAGCPVEMLRLPGMTHVGAITGPLPIRRAQNEALVEWMDRWVCGNGASAAVQP
jgi:dipeptidyl aminopeptidase/acylaminoacyl peptidase